MIISHKHKFIFIKTSKTAGTSIEIALSSICGPEDIITPITASDEKVRKKLGYRGPQNTLVPFSKYSLDDWFYLIYKFRRVRYFNHVRGVKVKQWIGKEIWDSYYKFCFERNPYDKVVSHYFWRGGERKFGSIRKYLKSSKLNLIKAKRQYRINGEVAVDKIYKFEELKQSMEEIAQVLNLGKPLELPSKKTKSSSRKDKRHWSEILSNEEKKSVNRIFEHEFALMNYPIEKQS